MPPRHPPTQQRISQLQCLTLFSIKSKRRSNLSHSGTPLNQRSDQEKVSDPFPTFFETLSPNRSSPIPPTLSRIIAISLHHEDYLLPPSLSLPLSIPYRATNTLNHNLPRSTSIFQFHLPSRARLNSLNCRTPKN
jgi:hypothetical protein